MALRSLDDAPLPAEPLRSEPLRARPFAQAATRAAAADVEDDLARRAAAGDVGAFDALVTVFGGRVMGIAARMLADRGEAEDLTQEVFIALYDALPTFRGESRVSTWIYRITRNRCLNRIEHLKRRKSGRLADIDDPAVANHVVDPDTSGGERADPTQRIRDRELRVVLEEHLRRLPEEQRLLVVLRDLEELSYEEIVDVTGIPLGTVKSRLHRARAELARALGPHFERSSRVANGRDGGSSR